MQERAELGAREGMSRGLILLFAIASGAAVGNLYWAQPLLVIIANEMRVSPGHAGLLVTVTQVGYAAGVFLLVPLGDTLNRRRLIPGVMTCSAVALLASALAPSFAMLMISLTVVGLTTVAGQLLIPLAGDLAREDQRGQVVGTVVSGVLSGILASRTISGLVADAFGWRMVYAIAACFTLLVAVLLIRVLPVIPPRASVPYKQLLLSVLASVRAHRTVQVTLILGSSAVAVFSLFWTGLTFHLSAPPFSYSLTQIGLVGLMGLAGALAAQRAGRLHDSGWSVPATGAALLLAFISLGIAALGATSISLLLAAVLLIDIAIQAMNVLNQSRLMAVDPTARSRLNTAFITGNFAGAAVGSMLASMLWQRGGWSMVTLGGAVLIGLAFVVWLTQRKRALALTSPVPSGSQLR